MQDFLLLAIRPDACAIRSRTDIFRASEPSGRLPAANDWTTIRSASEKTGPCRGTGRLFINGSQVSEARLPRTYKYFMDWEGFALGRDAGSPVSPAYADRGEFPFSGQIDHVVIRLGTDLAGPNDYETGD